MTSGPTHSQGDRPRAHGDQNGRLACLADVLALDITDVLGIGDPQAPYHRTALARRPDAPATPQ